MATVSGEALSNGAEPATALAAQGAMAHAPATVKRAPEAKVVPRDTNRRRGCRKATPGP